jgi:hypothetical protein
MRHCGRDTSLPVLRTVLLAVVLFTSVLAVASDAARGADGEPSNAAPGDAAATAKPSPTAARPGRVEFSDGRVLEGRISVTPGRQLKVYTSKTASRSFPLGSLQEMRFVPLSTKVESAWRFSAMGSDEKEHAGAPIPHRELLTTATLANGETLVGQLDMAVLYVETADGAEKLILSHTQNGSAGQALDDLVYPTRVVFTDRAAIAQESSLFDLTALGAKSAATLSAVHRESLKPLEVHPGARPGAFRVASPLGEGLFLALREGNRVLVGWPHGDPGSAELREQAWKAMAEAQNFFTVRHLLGAWADESGTHLCALVTLGREKPEKWAGFPWCLSVWRWDYDKKTGSVRQPPEEGLLLRIVDAQKEPPPEAILSAELWQSQGNKP